MEIADALGADRVLEPRGALPQRGRAPRRLGPGAAARARAGGRAPLPRLDLAPQHPRARGRRPGADGRADPRDRRARAARCTTPRPTPAASCSARSTAVGERYRLAAAARRAGRDARLADADPAAARAVTRLDPDSPQVEVEGTAYVFERACWAPIPDDLPLATALELFDVCAAACQTRRARRRSAAPSACSAPATRASWRWRRPERRRRPWSRSTSTPSAVDLVASARALRHRRRRRPARPAGGGRGGRGAAGAPPADLTVVVVNATGCEPTALLLTADEGTILFFSMATSFSAAALAADGIGTSARMIVGSGYARRPRRVRARARPARAARKRSAAPRRSGRSRSARTEAVRARPRACRCAGATSTGSATSTTPSCSPTSRRAATPSCRSAGSPATSTWSAAARSASTARSTRRSSR